MSSNLVFGLSALFAMLPASLLAYRRGPGQRDLVFWAVLAVAAAGPLGYSMVQVSGSWNAGFATALWLSIAASMTVFVAAVALAREAWRLTPLLLPYLALLALLAVIWGQAPQQAPGPPAPDAWLAAHILVSLATYGLATVAAVAGAGVFFQERALKRKQPTALSRLMPSIADGEALELRLLAGAGSVLGIGIATGMALQYFASGHVLVFDHKTFLSLLAFAVIGLLLVLRYRSGLRGRRAARLVLLAYLLLTLAYPGVKFVTDVLIG